MDLPTRRVVIASPPAGGPASRELASPAGSYRIREYQTEA